MKKIEIFTEDITSIWDTKRFEIVREPIIVEEYYSSTFPKLNNCLDMPIKLSNHETILLPYEYSKSEMLIELIHDALNFEKKINPFWKDYNMYLTFHNKNVLVGETQRNAGWHIDGLQGIMYPEKLKACHSYLFSDILPTEFAIQPFDVSNLSYKKHNWFNELGKQVLDENIREYGINKLVAMSAYQVHQSKVTDKNLNKNFIRIEFSLKEFNRLGNTINPLINTGWNYINREIPSHLIN